MFAIQRYLSVLIAVSVIACAVPRPVHAESSTIDVLSYNIRGAVRTDPTGDNGADNERFNIDPDPFRVVDVLAQRIADEQPQLVALQEVCGSQMNRLVTRLAERGYPMQPQFDGDTHGDSRCRDEAGAYPPLDVGKGVLARGSASTVDTGVGDLDVCLDVQAQVLIRFCSLHLDGDRLATTAGVLSDWVKRGLAPSGEQPTAVIVAGDFNTTPQDPLMTDMYFSDPAEDTYEGTGLFSEAAMCSTTGCERAGPATHTSNRKIDHVFGDHKYLDKQASTSHVESTASQCGEGGGQRCSDHDMLWAHLALRSPGPLAWLAGRYSYAGETSDGQPVLETIVISVDGYMDYFNDACSCAAAWSPLQDNSDGTYSATLVWREDPLRPALVLERIAPSESPEGLQLTVRSTWEGVPHGLQPD